MLYAIDSQSNKIRAEKNVEAYCPQCRGLVVAKMGEIMVHHWAHVSSASCDTWNKGETRWHLAWKSRFPKHCIEQRVTRGDVWHVADVLLPDGIVIEFQHSPISPVDIAKREEFYQRVIWVLDVKDAADRFNFRQEGNEIKFKWDLPRSSFEHSAAPVILDFGDGRMFSVSRWSIGCFFGWGKFSTRDEFIAKYTVDSCPIDLRGLTFNDIADGALGRHGYKIRAFENDAEAVLPWRPSIIIERI